MSYHGILDVKHCRWCGKRYYAHKPEGRDGFDFSACRQALYRARKKYVTSKKNRSTVRKIS